MAEQAARNVTNLGKYQPSGKTYQVALTFSGEAGASMSQLMRDLKTEDPNEVALRAIALLLSAQGKEILLRNPKSGATEAVEV